MILVLWLLQQSIRWTSGWIEIEVRKRSHLLLLFPVRNSAHASVHIQLFPETWLATLHSPFLIFFSNNFWNSQFSDRASPVYSDSARDTLHSPQTQPLSSSLWPHIFPRRRRRQRRQNNKIQQWACKIHALPTSSTGHKPPRPSIPTTRRPQLSPSVFSSTFHILY